MRTKQNRFSEDIKQILKQRQTAYIENKTEDITKLEKNLSESKRNDNTNSTLNTLKKELDIRDRWMGIRALKKDFKPTTYNLKTNQGRPIPYEERAEETAKHLNGNQWKKAKHETPLSNPKASLGPTLNLRETPFTIAELNRTLKKFKEEKPQDRTKYPWKPSRS